MSSQIYLSMILPKAELRLFHTLKETDHKSEPPKSYLLLKTIIVFYGL